MSCKFCGARTEKHIGQSLQGFNFDYDYCSSCRVMTRPHDQDYTTFTRETLERVGHLDIDGIGRQYTHVADRIVREKPKGRLLDYGCATGGVLKLMKGRGFEVFGYDVAPVSIEVCKEHGLPGTTNLKEIEGTFDVIWCSETIEHLEDPFEFINFAKDHINPRGIVYIQTQQPALNGESYDLAYQPAHSVLMSPWYLDRVMLGRGFTILEAGQNDLGCYWRYYRA